MKNIIYILLFLFASNCYSQQFTAKEQKKIDSLNFIISNLDSPDSSLASAYVGLSDILYVSNVDTLKPLCEKAIIIAERSLKQNPPIAIKIALNKSLADAISNIGYYYGEKGDIEKQTEYYTKSLKIREQILLPNGELADKKGIASSLNNIGHLYEKQGDVKKALEYWHKSLKIREEIGNKKGIANSLINIGYIMSTQGSNDKALEYYLKSLKIEEEIKNNKGIALCYNNIGGIYYSKRDMDEALKYYTKALEVRKELGHKKGIANSLNNIANVYEYRNDLTKASEYWHKSLSIKEEIGDKVGIALSLNDIGINYLKAARKATSTQEKNKNLLQAEKNVSRSLNMAKEMGIPDNIKRSSKILYKIYALQNKGMQAFEMHKLYISMRDSINNRATQKAIARQEAKYKYEKQKVLDDAKHDKQLTIEKEEKAKQKIITIATACGLFLVVVFLVFVFNRLRITKKQKLIIEEQKEVVEQAHSELEEKNKEILDSINYAKRIQSAILPPDKIVKEYLKDSFIIYKPKDIVAGDFYWMEQIAPAGKNKESMILFAAADCTGHGVPGAMVSVVCNNALNRSVREHSLTDPGKILDKTREIVIAEFEKSDEDVKDGMDIALCAIEGNVLHYAGALNPLWIIRNGEVIETKANKQPIGKFDNPQQYTTHTFELQKGDSIYIFSDGYIDQFGGEKGKKFKSRSFRELLISIQDKSMEVQKTILDEAFENWKGNLEQIDDVCIIGVRI